MYYFFLKFLQINNNSPYLLAAQKKTFFILNFCKQATWNEAFWTPPCIQNWSYGNKIDLDAQLMCYFSRSLLLVFVIFQISNLEAILYLGHFLYTL